ncbi:pyridoxamine 5'-phosphate oxidase family protein [Marinobacter sp. DUT-3]|uniref:pyridoxamine 5'-phosphate oxidase family protein n=1 Tax=Marinobacter sp. DUT-3 TaxID=3412036 RepID=UPI003D179523
MMADDTAAHGVWHQGELAVQSRAGVREKMATIGARVIRDYMPDQHREFFTQLPMVILGAQDMAGELWATALFGKPGFIQSPAERLLTIDAQLPSHDPLASSLYLGSSVGLLGIQLETRRRNRANGTIAQREGGRIALSVEQSFGNCAKYIRRRYPVPNEGYGDFVRESFTTLIGPVVQLIRAADTFFIASAFNDGEPGANRGVDVSHRGGEPGFIGLDDQHRLLVPDYVGNNFFNTIGNLAVDPRAGLLFLDFQRGHAVHLTARAEVVWRGDETQIWGEGDRMLRLTLVRGCIIYNASPYIWRMNESDEPACTSRF